MAQKHKAPTQVTIAATEESPLHDWVRRFWKIGVVAAVAIAALVLGVEWNRQRKERELVGSWDRFREDVTLGAGLFGGITPPSAEALGGLATELRGSVAGPWARGLEVHALVADGQYDRASETLRTLGEEYPEHPLVTETYRFGEGETASTLAEHLTRRMDAVGRWEREHSGLFQNPSLASDCPKVRLNTTKGAILLGLYPDKAPKHVENFLKLCREGYYNGTLFHRIGRDFMIQGGDPNSRDNPDKSTWGQGGPEEKIPSELSDLRHFPMVLAAAKTALDKDSSGSQFYITVGAPHHLDGVHTVFGALIDGEAVVKEIASGEIEQGQTDRPRDPVAIQSTDVLL
jgi:cyclophilin family peptidyl-prolyl cis-trans isomerase